jgi:hypothetical protein
MKYLLLLTLVACGHVYQPVDRTTKEVIRTTNEVEATNEPPVIVLDKERLKKVVFTTNSSLPYMAEVARISNCIVNNEAFLKEVETFPKFTHTDKTPAQVAESLRNPKPVVLSTYRTKNPFSSAIATTFSGDPTTVYFNTRKNPRPMPEMVNTSCHEGLGHIQGFGHGDNYPSGKEDSQPYRVGSICEKYVSACEKE